MAWQNAPMSAFGRLAAIIVALLVVIGIAVVGLNLADSSPTGELDGSASVSPSAQPSTNPDPTPSVAPSPPDPDEALAILEQIEQEVIAIRGLPAADIGAPDLITRAELGEELTQLFEEEYPPEEQERDNIALRALGLLGPDQDVAELQLQLLGDQVLGFYDDVEKRMVVVTDAGLDANAKLTYAHEYTHALQDAAFGLDSLETDAVGEDDRGLARTGLIEGDATVTMLAWAFANLTPEELVEIGTGAVVPDTTGIPSWMVRQLEFPYTDGFNWAAALAGDPTDPDFTELDAAFGEPPDSTEQIIDLDKWAAREEPAAVELPDLAAELGDGWEEVDSTPIGEATIRIILEYHGVSRDEALAAGAGWGGDRCVIASTDDGEFAVAWRLSWDSSADAGEFIDAYRGIVDSLPVSAVVTDIGEGDVLVVHGSSDDILRRTVDAVGG